MAPGNGQPVDDPYLYGIYAGDFVQVWTSLSWLLFTTGNMKLVFTCEGIDFLCLYVQCSGSFQGIFRYWSYGINFEQRDAYLLQTHRIS